MHASLNQLLNLRDGEPVTAGTAEHVGNCSQCTAEVTRLTGLRERMRVLGKTAPPETGADAMWQRIETALAAPALRPQLANGYLALAAVVVWAAIALLWYGLAGHDPDGTLRTATSPQPAALTQLLLESQDLESALLELPRRPRVEQAATAATLDALEGEIQWLDYTLSRAHEDRIPAEQATQLWQQRVDLLESLVTLRYAQASRLSF